MSLPSDTEILDGPGVWFGLFSNDASGVVQGDGSLAPLDQNEPAWLFVWTLNDSVIAGRRLPGGNPAGHHPPGDCVFLAFVTTTALIPIAGQECKSPDGPPVFVVKV